jgi:hypothetical protein
MDSSSTPSSPSHRGGGGWKNRKFHKHNHNNNRSDNRKFTSYNDLFRNRNNNSNNLNSSPLYPGVPIKSGGGGGEEEDWNTPQTTTGINEFFHSLEDEGADEGLNGNYGAPGFYRPSSVQSENEVSEDVKNFGLNSMKVSL